MDFFIETIKTGGSVASPLVTIFFLWKLGLLGGKKNGNGNEKYQIQIDELKEHSRVANDEMGQIRSDISDIKADLSFIRGKLDNN